MAKKTRPRDETCLLLHPSIQSSKSDTNDRMIHTFRTKQRARIFIYSDKPLPVCLESAIHFIMITWFLDALLAAVYLKWIHPWRILLQEVSSLLLETQLFDSPLVRNQINGSVTGLTKKG